MFARALYRQEQYDASLLEAQQAFGQARGASTLSPTAGLLATPPGQQAYSLWYWCPSLNVGDENSGTLGCAWGTAICIRENSVSSGTLLPLVTHKSAVVG